MKRMTTITAIAILITATEIQAGWLSNIGQRIINGAVNTVQTNISGKVNRTIDDAMDGKLASKQKNNTQSHVDNYTGQPGLPTSGVSAGGPAIVETQESTYRGARGKALKVTGKYEEIDAGIFKFRAESIYYKELRIGQTKIEIDEFLDPGYYAIWVNPSSRTYSVSTMYEHEEKGLEWGFGIKTVKRIFNNGPYNMLGNKEGLLHIVEILPGTQGHIELTVVNSQERMGTAEVMIYHIPGPKLEILK